MKGIILAGGKGSRLYPSTLMTNKNILPIYDKPLIYYPLNILLSLNIRAIAMISSPSGSKLFEGFFRDGSDLGINLHHMIQEKEMGIADAFLIAEDFIKKNPSEGVCLILADNLFFGEGLETLLKTCKESFKLTKDGIASCLARAVKDPERFGVVEIDGAGNALSIEEKPKKPKSNLAVTGLYFYPNDVVEKAKNLKPSPRGELEITDINKMYLNDGKLKVVSIPNNVEYFDAGTPSSMLEAGNKVKELEDKNKNLIACIEETALKNGWLNKKALEKRYEFYRGEYREYLENLSRS